MGRRTAQMLTGKFKATGLHAEVLSVAPWEGLGGCSRSWGAAAASKCWMLFSLFFVRKQNSSSDFFQFLKASTRLKK